MSTPINKRRLLQQNTPKEQVSKSPARTPKTVKQVREQKAATNLLHSTLLNEKKKKRNSTVPARLAKSATPVKANRTNDTKSTTSVKKKLNSNNKIQNEEKEQGHDSFSTVVLEQNNIPAEKSLSRQHNTGNSNNSSIKVAVRVRPFSERYY